MHTHTSLRDWSLLVLVLLIGIVLRLWIAPQIVNGDAIITQKWMESAVKLGVAPSYNTQVNDAMLPLYPPVSLYLFYGAGMLYRTIISPSYELIQPAHLVFVKLPAITADSIIIVALCLLLWRYKKRWSGLIAAGIYAIHPAVLYDTVVWGQTDSIYSCAVLLSVIALLHARWVLGTVIMVLACFIKPQAIAFLPLLAWMLPWNLRTILRTGLAAVATVIVVALPFFLHGNPERIIDTYGVFQLLGETRISWNAYNLWWLLLGSSGSGMPGSTVVFAGISYRTIGLILFFSTTFLALWWLRKPLRLDTDTRSLARMQAAMLACTLIALAFFILNAEMHERYLFPVLLFALPLAIRSVPMSILYAILSCTYLLNLVAVFPFSSFDRWLFASVPGLSMLLAAIQTLSLVLILFLTWRMRRMPLSSPTHARTHA